MSRVSAFRGTFNPTKRPYVVLTADAYVSIQGETTVIGCGECRREVNLNRYVTGIETEASIDSSPGSATVTLSIPDNDVNSFYVDGQLIIIPMMEIELYAKGYYLIGGFPQYYRIFWGMVTSTSKSWSNGVTTITIACKDILRWWELTQLTINPAFLAPEGSTAGNYQLFGNQFAGANPYTVIIALAKEAMGDFSITTGSLTSFKPEDGAENGVIGSYAKDIMTYWQLKFGNIWNSLVLFGTSGQAYTFAGSPGNVSPLQITRQLFDAEQKNLNLNPQSALFKIHPDDIAAFKIEVANAGNVEFFQTENQSKLAIAMTARDQSGNEFYCDTTGDIIFKPPFYNLNVLPNKPTSWIQDFEIIEDSITDTEQEVYTHVTASGNAFGGKTDWGINDEFTTPKTGVIDFHLLRRYGWRRTELSVEWAGDPKKLFYHLLDWIDRVNSKRQNGTITIPLRPEIRMGFPCWIPKYDAFFYIQAISHNFSPGGQATTTLTLTAKRSKFIAPKNIGKIIASGSRTVIAPADPKTGKPSGPPQKEISYTISFPSDVGNTSGNSDGRDTEDGGPAILRDPKTGKLLGFPNAVMVYRKAVSGEVLARVLANHGSKKGGPKPTKQDKNKDVGPKYTYNEDTKNALISLQNASRAKTIERLRHHRYESGMSNAGLYDYAQDTQKVIKEFSVVPADSITWGSGTDDPDEPTPLAPTQGAQTFANQKALQDSINATVNQLNGQLKIAKAEFNKKNTIFKNATSVYNKYRAVKYKGKKAPRDNQLDSEDSQQKLIVDNAQADQQTWSKNVADLQNQINTEKAGVGNIRKLKSLNIMIRPVSDEFGFEVIGHYRYGRGVFIDRGQVKIIDPTNNSNTMNQINIQFAATGGLLTENPRLDNLGPESQTFSQAFEKMEPDDYRTGASFAGANYGSNDVNAASVNYTNQNTYSDAVKHAIADTGHAIFAEADATRRAITLAELSPTMTNGLDEAQFNRCACALGRANWLSVLPQSFIDQVLRPVSATKSTPVSTLEGVNPALAAAIIPVTQETIQVAEGNNFSLSAGGGGFFDVLHNFLVDRFNADYHSNTEREQFAGNGGRQVFAPSSTPEETNILAAPDDTLFNRASQGDPNALKAMEVGANFNFGLSKKALDNFKVVANQSNKQLNRSLAQLPGSIFSATTGGLKNPPGTISTAPVKPQVQPPSNPVIGDILNPRKNSYSTPYIDFRDINSGVGKTPGTSD